MLKEPVKKATSHRCACFFTRLLVFIDRFHYIMCILYFSILPAELDTLLVRYQLITVVTFRYTIYIPNKQFDLYLVMPPDLDEPFTRTVRAGHLV